MYDLASSSVGQFASRNLIFTFSVFIGNAYRYCFLYTLYRARMKQQTSGNNLTDKACPVSAWNFLFLFVIRCEKKSRYSPLSPPPTSAPGVRRLKFSANFLLHWLGRSPHPNQATPVYGCWEGGRLGHPYLLAVQLPTRAHHHPFSSKCIILLSFEPGTHSRFLRKAVSTANLPAREEGPVSILNFHCRSVFRY